MVYLIVATALLLMSTLHCC